MAYNPGGLGARCFFVSDLHGQRPRYSALQLAIERERPAAVFLGGDLMPSLLPGLEAQEAFLDDVLAPALARLRERLAGRYPRVFLILGNDDSRVLEPALREHDAAGLWQYVHARRVEWNDRAVYGYACVPPTPFRLKDWERYDVSRYVDPGSIAPEEGWHTVERDTGDLRHGTIQADLAALAGEADLARDVFLFHAPPHASSLDRAALDGRTLDGVPLDVHVGSIAIRRFIEARQPALTLHGHIHESARLTGAWRQRFGRSVALSAAHDGRELALVRFDADDPEGATRELIG